ncbi:hypothetical protein GQ457_01G026830 [Hibiscus cannabinus]
MQHEIVSTQTQVHGVVAGKVNTFADGAMDLVTGDAMCGGVVKDTKGSCLIGYSCRLGVCLIIEAELSSIYEGLLLAWSFSVCRLQVESDYLEAVRLVQNMIVVH